MGFDGKEGMERERKRETERTHMYVILDGIRALKISEYLSHCPVTVV